jgi:hypothetical protein
MNPSNFKKNQTTTKIDPIIQSIFFQRSRPSRAETKQRKNKNMPNPCKISNKEIKAQQTANKKTTTTTKNKAMIRDSHFVLYGIHRTYYSI